MGLDGNEGHGKYITPLLGLQVSFIIIHSECSMPEQGPDYSVPLPYIVIQTVMVRNMFF